MYLDNFGEVLANNSNKLIWFFVQIILVKFIGKKGNKPIFWATAWQSFTSVMTCNIPLINSLLWKI